MNLFGGKLKAFINRLQGKNDMPVEPDIEPSPFTGHRNMYKNWAFANPTPTPTPTPQAYVLGTKARDQLDFSNSDDFAQVAIPLAEKYKFPASIAMGQYAGETRGRKGTMADRNNFYNLGAVDSDPNRATSFETPEQGIEAYLKFITGQAPVDFYGNGAFGKQKHMEAYNEYQQALDEDMYLQRIKDMGYASRPDYVEFIKSIPEYRKYKKYRL